MAKWANDNVMDFGLNWLISSIGANATLVLLSGDPGAQAADGKDTTSTGYTSATTASGGTNYNLATDTGLDLSGLSIADGASQGRRVTIPARTGIAITTAGLATHIGIVDATLNAGSGGLVYVTALDNPQQVYTGNTVSPLSWDITINDVTP